jgi:NAD(P)H-dependent flavin oxidoreductase YrpB (nitropropane dioxygenase family)
VTAEEILAKARADGVDVVLTTAGDGLELLSAGDPPPNIVALLKDAKTEVVSRLQMERRMNNH